MTHSPQQPTNQIPDQISGLNIPETLAFWCDRYPGKVTFSTSFSAEDQVITDYILSNHLPVSIFTLDTGRLFAETYSVWSMTNDKYPASIKPYYPDRTLLEPYLEKNGPNAFYESIPLRKECCHIRKVEPLGRALEGQSVWITGLRAEHSPERKDLSLIEWDQARQLIKYNPLLNWTTDELKEYISAKNVPYNILHDRGYVSIGCAPCTRAVKPGEDFRAGRWWWEESEKKECGLHTAV